MLASPRNLGDGAYLLAVLGSTSGAAAQEAAPTYSQRSGSPGCTGPAGLGNCNPTSWVWCNGGIPDVPAVPLRVGVVIRVQRTLGALAAVVEAGSGERFSDAPWANINFG